MKKLITIFCLAILCSSNIYAQTKVKHDGNTTQNNTKQQSSWKEKINHFNSSIKNARVEAKKNYNEAANLERKLESTNEGFDSQKATVIKKYQAAMKKYEEVLRLTKERNKLYKEPSSTKHIERTIGAIKSNIEIVNSIKPKATKAKLVINTSANTNTKSTPIKENTGANTLYTGNMLKLKELLPKVYNRSSEDSYPEAKLEKESLVFYYKKDDGSVWMKHTFDLKKIDDIVVSPKSVTSDYWYLNLVDNDFTSSSNVSAIHEEQDITGCVGMCEESSYHRIMGLRTGFKSDPLDPKNELEHEFYTVLKSIINKSN